MRAVYLKTLQRGKSQKGNVTFSLKQEWIWYLSLCIFLLVLSASSRSHGVHLLSCCFSHSQSSRLKWPDYVSAWLSGDPVVDSPKGTVSRLKKKRKPYIFFSHESLWKKIKRKWGWQWDKLNDDKTCFTQWFWIYKVTLFLRATGILVTAALIKVSRQRHFSTRNPHPYCPSRLLAFLHATIRSA